MQLTVEKLVYGGHGLSRLDGRVVLTPLVLPGEEITAEPVDKLHARAIHIDKPAPLRVAAPCPYFGICGGCHYQHAPYEYQLAQKVDILREVLRRVGRFEAPADINVISADPWGYRNRIQLHVEDGQIGYLRMGSHSLCPVDKCPISSPRINEAIGVLNELVMERRWPEFISIIELFTNETEVQLNVLETGKPLARHFFDWCAEHLPGYASGAIDCLAASERFRVGPRSFFQVNRFLVDALVDAALSRATEGQQALDLYAGVGLFSLPLARRFGQVTAVEGSASGVADLRFNSERAGVSIEAIKAETSEYLTGLDTTPDFVLADPPRDGLGKNAVRELIRLRPKRLTILACDPATLARDLQGLLESGYQIEAMTLVDLFPQTYHLETIVHCFAT
ncbi:MAG: class I SAM-dependent RNA methyltransferase [Bryobacteraceae bacterium]|nr:class I SAM-dependent RNA methyltransferase [Bryobacteraceae bacterium]